MCTYWSTRGKVNNIIMKNTIKITLIAAAMLGFVGITFGRTYAEIQIDINSNRVALLEANGRPLAKWPEAAKQTMYDLYVEAFQTYEAENNKVDLPVVSEIITAYDYVKYLPADKTDVAMIRDAFSRIGTSDAELSSTPNLQYVWLYINRHQQILGEDAPLNVINYCYYAGNVGTKLQLYKKLGKSPSQALLDCGKIAKWTADHQTLFDRVDLLDEEWKAFCTTLFGRILPVEENIEIKTLLKRIMDGQ